MELVETAIISERHLLNSATNLPDIAAFSISKSKCDGAPVLDIGAGNDRLSNFLSDFLPFSTVVSLDLDLNQLQRNSHSNPITRGVCATAEMLPFGERTFSLVTLVNAAHEICAADSREMRWYKFHQLIRGVSQVLGNNGKLTFYDGFMPESSIQMVQFKALSKNAVNKLVLFSNTYLGMKIYLEQKGDNYRLPLDQLMCFLSKFPYVGGDFWENERKQLYPFLTQAEITGVFNDEGFNIDSIQHPTNRKGLINFLADYAFDDLDLKNFPQLQMCISAIKTE
jgi:hypothetical protein